MSGQEQVIEKEKVFSEEQLRCAICDALLHFAPHSSASEVQSWLEQYTKESKRVLIHE